MIALVMAGTFFGVLVNELLPETVVYIMLILTLTYLSYSALAKSIETHKKEKAAKAKAAAAAAAEDDMKSTNSINHHMSKDKSEEKFHPLLEHPSHTVKDSELHNISLRKSQRESSRQSMAKGEVVDESDTDIKDEDRDALIGTRRSTYKPTEVNNVLQTILKNEKSQFRLRNIVVVVIPVIVVIMTTLLRGTTDFKSIADIKRCDALDFVCLAAMVVILVIQSK